MKKIINVACILIGLVLLAFAYTTYAQDSEEPSANETPPAQTPPEQVPPEEKAPEQKPPEVKPLPPEEKPAAAVSEKTYNFTVVLKEKDKFEVMQSQKWDGSIVIKSAKEQKYPFLKFVQNKFIDNIIFAGETIMAERSYEVSHIRTDVPAGYGKDGIRNEATSLQGKKLAMEFSDTNIISTKVLNKEDNVILREDRALITHINEYRFLLPKNPVKLGEAWQFDAKEIGKSILKNDYKEETCEIVGQAKLEEIVSYQNNNCAKILVSIKIACKESKDAPGFSVELKGLCYYAIDRNAIVSVDLKGPFAFTKNIALVGNADSSVEVKAGGNISIGLALKLVK